MKRLAFALKFVSRFMCGVAVAALVAMMVLTMADVVLRAFNRPILGTYELVGILGAVVIGFAIPFTSMTRGHVIMDFLTDRLSGTARTALHMLTRLVAIAFFVIAAWNLCRLGSDYSKAGEFTLTLKLPLYPIPYGIAFCCFVECLILFGEMIGIKHGAEE